MSNRNLIHCEMWPRDTIFAGKLIDYGSPYFPSDRIVFRVHPSDAELLIAEFERTPRKFEQEAARSLSVILREWRENISREDDGLVPGRTTGGKVK